MTESTDDEARMFRRSKLLPSRSITLAISLLALIAIKRNAKLHKGFSVLVSLVMLGHGSELLFSIGIVRLGHDCPAGSG